MNASSLPVTLLAGSLGSGKTTLLNTILQENHGKRIAVIENEIGDISIDHELVIGADEDIFEMKNGCICCSVRSDLIETLNRLLDRRDKIDYIVIEGTGIASPAPVAQAFLVEEAIVSGLHLDGVITLVDAKHIHQQLNEIEVTWEQISFCNVILLNKTDLVTAEELQQVRDKVRAINPIAPIHETQRARIDLDQILNIGGFDLQKMFEGDQSFEEGHDGDEHEPDSPHAGVGSVSVSLKGTIDPDRFVSWLQMLGIMEGMDVFRAKGILSVPDSARRHIFQSIYMMFDIREEEPWGDRERENRLVFIGRHLDRERLLAGVQTCLV